MLNIQDVEPLWVIDNCFEGKLNWGWKVEGKAFFLCWDVFVKILVLCSARIMNISFIHDSLLKLLKIKLEYFLWETFWALKFIFERNLNWFSILHTAWDNRKSFWRGLIDSKLWKISCFVVIGTSTYALEKSKGLEKNWSEFLWMLKQFKQLEFIEKC